MSLGEKIKAMRQQAVLSQEQLAEKLNVSRQAVTKWETGKGIPDIANLIAISDEFDVSLDELIKDDISVKKKIISDSSSKKWHILVIVYLVAITAYIIYFAIYHRIFMIGSINEQICNYTKVATNCLKLKTSRLFGCILFLSRKQ